MFAAIAVATLAQTSVKLTFDRTGTAAGTSSPTSVSVNVTDADDTPLTGVTASLVNTNFTEFLNTGQAPITRATNSVLVPKQGTGYGNGNNSEITYTFKIDGLAGFCFNTADLDVYACNSAGNAQPTSNNRPFTFVVGAGDAEGSISTVAEQTSQANICAGALTDNSLIHSIYSFNNHISRYSVAPSASLYVKVTLTKRTADGCFAGIASVTLSDYLYISKTSGDLSGTTTWASKSGVTPSATLTTTAGNIQWNSDNFKFSANGATNYTITLPANFSIEKLVATFIDGTARESFVTIGGNQQQINSGATTTMTFDGLSGNSVTMTLDHKANVAGNRYMYTPCIAIVYKEAYNVTYVVQDESGNELYNTGPVAVGKGNTISELPAEYRRDLFYDYTCASLPATVTGDMTLTFTATPKSSAPFLFTADATNPVWYGLRIHGGAYARYPTYVSGGNPNVTLPATNAQDATTCWAFVGNPYQGFQVINRQAGTTFVLGSETPVNDGNTGANTYATLNNSGTKTYETWTATASTHYTNGFFLANAQDYKLNYRSDNNLAYWTGGYGAGSTFVATPIKDWLAGTLTAANALKTIYDTYAGNPCFPTAAADSTFATAIATAQNVYDNGGDYLAARNALRTAISTVKADSSLVFTPQTDKVYNIECSRGWWAVGSGASDVNSTAELGLATMAADTKQQFAFIPYGDNYYLYSVGEGKFAYMDGTKLSLTDVFTAEVEASPVTFTRSTHANSDNYPAIVTIDGNHFGVSQGMSPDVYKYQGLNDEGNAARIVAQTAFDNTSAVAAAESYFLNDLTYVVQDEEGTTLFTSPAINTSLGTHITTLPAAYQHPAFYTYDELDLTTTEQHTTATFTATLKPQEEWPVLFTEEGATTPVYNNLKIRGQYFVYDSEATDLVKLQATSEPFTPSAAWAFVGSPYAGFKMINQEYGSSQYLIYTSVVTGGNSGNHNIQFQSAEDLGAKRWIIDVNSNGFVLRMKENTDIYFHHDNGGNFLRTCSKTEWSSVHTDAGSTIVATNDYDEVENLYESMNDMVFGPGLGHFSADGITDADANGTIVGASSAIASHNYAAYPDLYNYLMTLKNVATINTPSAGTFLRIKGGVSNKYLAGGALTGGTFSMTNATDATTVFYYNDSKLINLATGDANGLNGSTWAWVTGNSASTVTFQDGYTEGGYGINSATVNLYDKGDENRTDRGTGVNLSTGDVKYRSWQLEEITSLPVTITATAYSTLYLPVSVTIPEGVVVLSAIVDEMLLRFTPVEDVIPANTPVILYAPAILEDPDHTPVTYTFAITSETGTAPASNLLEGAAVSTACEARANYTLQKKEGNIGFYLYTGTKLAGFKAYLPYSEVHTQGIRGFAFSDAIMEDITTGVGAVQTAADRLPVYDLQGRRVQSPTKGGIYIVGGRKTIVK